MDVGLEKIGVYFIHWQNTVAQYIATLPIFWNCGGRGAEAQIDRAPAVVVSGGGYFGGWGRGGGGQGRSGARIVAQIVTKYYIVTEPNCSLSDALGWNPATHNI